jgi:hypothetical protein
VREGSADTTTAAVAVGATFTSVVCESNAAAARSMVDVGAG